ncbi:MAG: phospholipase D family protein [Caldilineaceae bacterium]|nr:phospholipase D family protein [Caldilineaceae bacterium]
MDKTFLLQRVTFDNHFEAVKQILENPHPDRVILCVAFMSESGISSLADLLAPIAEQTIIVAGIRNDITSAQGLKKSIQLGCQTYVANTNLPKAMFHSKMYFSRSASEARLLIGSANLTKSGLFYNIEASVFMTMYMDDAEDKNFTSDFEGRIDNMIAEYKDNILQISNDSEVEGLLESGLVIDEEKGSDLAMSDSLEKPISDTMPQMKLKGPKMQDRSIDSALEGQFGRTKDSPRKTIEELLLDCREDGLTLEETAELVNYEGYRTKTEKLYSARSVWHDSTFHPRDRCPRSGNWARTCKNSRHMKFSFTRGDVFPDCPLCDSCKWGILPVSQD